MNEHLNATTPATGEAIQSPREYVAAMIDDLAAKGWKGEHILKMIERQTLCFSDEQKRLAFFRTSDVTDDEAEAA